MEACCTDSQTRASCGHESQYAAGKGRMDARGGAENRDQRVGMAWNDMETVLRRRLDSVGYNNVRAGWSSEAWSRGYGYRLLCSGLRPAWPGLRQAVGRLPTRVAV